LTTKGFGTEQIQQELMPFPDYKIGRMDQDTTRKFGFEKIIDSFKNRKLTF
jgi:primosomal protein N' (replication factor Y)